MDEYLDNPVYHALLSGDAALASTSGEIKFFDREISPFVGFRDDYADGFNDLFRLFPPGREIVYAIREQIDVPKGWKLIRHIGGTQFVLDSEEITFRLSSCPDLVALDPRHADEMVQLAGLTRPGPFDKRTIEFGSYYGVFHNNKLVAMTGQRLHVHQFTEVSAVCTHPDHLGKGYASQLLEHQVGLILRAGQTPFLHVKSDNDRAIFLYEKLGFRKNGPMNFYFMVRN